MPDKCASKQQRLLHSSDERPTHAFGAYLTGEMRIVRSRPVDTCPSSDRCAHELDFHGVPATRVEMQ